MNLILIKVLVAVALVAGLVFGWNWHINHEQGIGYQKAVAEYTHTSAYGRFFYARRKVCPSD